MDLKIGFFAISLIALCGCGGPSSSGKQLSGKELFSQHCASCHGADGKLGLSGASDLSKSKLSVEQISEILDKGRNGMPAMKVLLQTPKNSEAVSTYTLELRK